MSYQTVSKSVAGKPRLYCFAYGCVLLVMNSFICKILYFVKIVLFSMKTASSHTGAHYVAHGVELFLFEY